MEIISEIISVPVKDQQNVFGQFDGHLKRLERQLHVDIVDRNGEVKISGDAPFVKKAKAVLQELAELSMRGNVIQEQNVDYAIAMSMEENQEVLLEIDKELICHTVTGKPIKPKTLGQKEYVDAIRGNMVVFGLGPAGTGKTYLAVCLAVQAYKQKQIDKIILTRPAVEAGEKLGFLPGDLQTKVDPYLRPLYDALEEMLGAETYLKLMERGTIEVAPLAYMRGRTLSNAFIILDEAQNTTREQMKMFLTRLGDGSKMVVTGDVTQIDLPDGKRSGLEHAVNVLKDVDGIAEIYLTDKDVVRNPLVMSIVRAYEAAGRKNDKDETD